MGISFEGGLGFRCEAKGNEACLTDNLNITEWMAVPFTDMGRNRCEEGEQLGPLLVVKASGCLLSRFR